MCNLYAMMKGRAEAAKLVRALRDRNDNQPPQSGIYPDYEAPVVVVGEDGDVFHYWRPLRLTWRCLGGQTCKLARELGGAGRKVEKLGDILEPI
jgi:hypothetical protein